MKLKFKHPLDTKSFLIGICASMTAVIIWDIIKYNRKMLEHQERYSNVEGNGDDTDKGEDPRYPTPVPIGGFKLCCLWGCDDCSWWGPGGGKVRRPKSRGRRFIRRR